MQMKTFSHRGWAAGSIENTLLAFKKSAEADLAGVEFDVRYGTDGRTVVCSHDKTNNPDELSFDAALQHLSGTNLELLIELKEYSDDFYREVVSLIRKNNHVDQTTLFGFPDVAKLFPWQNRDGIRLGVISLYPQDISRDVEMYNPDMVLLGWGTKNERLQFRFVWTFLSLASFFKKYAAVKFVIGVAYSEADKKWLSRQQGIYGITIDMPL